MKKVLPISVSIMLLQFIISGCFAQNAEVILTKISLKNQPLLERHEPFNRAIETPQLRTTPDGYVLSYIDVNFNSHLLLLDTDFQVFKDIRLSQSGIVNVCTDNEEIAILKVKYTKQPKISDDAHSEHQLYFERYSYEGEKLSRVRLIGDPEFKNKRNSRSYITRFESKLIAFNGTYYAAFSFAFNNLKKYDKCHHRLVQITRENKVQVISTRKKRVLQTQLLVREDTLYHVYMQTRGPRAVLLQKYALTELSIAPIEKVEIKNPSSDIDEVLTVRSDEINLFAITDGADEQEFMCRDNLMPVRIEKVFFQQDQMKMVLSSMQGNKSYDIELVNYDQQGNLSEKVSIAKSSRYHESSCFVNVLDSSLFMVYRYLDSRDKSPVRSKAVLYNTQSGESQEQMIDISYVAKPVFQFYEDALAGNERLMKCDFRVNTRRHYHVNYNHLQTDQGMILLYWDENGFDLSQVLIPDNALLE